MVGGDLRPDPSIQRLRMSCVCVPIAGRGQLSSLVRVTLAGRSVSSIVTT